MIGIIGSIVSGLVSAGGSFMEQRKETSAAKHKQKLRKIDADANWDATAMAASAASWKDEYLTIIFTLPIILVFIEPTRASAIEGFIAVQENVPQEYWAVLGVIVAASFGFKKIADVFTRNK